MVLLQLESENSLNTELALLNSHSSISLVLLLFLLYAQQLISICVFKSEICSVFYLLAGNDLACLIVRLQLRMEGEELTEQETALYDRQIRVWGADAQRRFLSLNFLCFPFGSFF